ncbi:MAG TPA: hypothetical protein VNJ47_06025 [Nevskiales bacterium]|nr:hypothetical protein [Nevskiales bacterium]
MPRIVLHSAAAVAADHPAGQCTRLAETLHSLLPPSSSQARLRCTLSPAAAGPALRIEHRLPGISEGVLHECLRQALIEVLGAPAAARALLQLSPLDAARAWPVYGHGAASADTADGRPLPQVLAQRLIQRSQAVAARHGLAGLCVQVCMRYRDGVAQRVEAVALRSPGARRLRDRGLLAALLAEVIDPVLVAPWQPREIHLLHPVPAAVAVCDPLRLRLERLAAALARGVVAAGLARHCAVTLAGAADGRLQVSALRLEDAAGSSAEAVLQLLRRRCPDSLARLALTPAADPATPVPLPALG